MKQAVSTPDAPKAIGPYSQAVRAGQLLFVSGQVPLDPATGQIVTGDIAAQTRRVFDNLGAVLDVGILGWVAANEIPFLLEVVEAVGVLSSDVQRLVQNADVRYLDHALCSASKIALAPLVPATHPSWPWTLVCYCGTIA